MPFKTLAPTILESHANLLHEHGKQLYMDQHRSPGSYTVEEFQCSHLRVPTGGMNATKKMALGETLVPVGPTWWPVPITEFL